MTTNGERGPLEDDGWGEARRARQERRCRSYVAAGRLQLDGRGGASVRLDFPRASGKGQARTQAARALAAALDVEARSVFTVRRSLDGDRLVIEDRAVTVHGSALAVARFVEALPRILDYAETLATLAVRAYGRWARSWRAEAYLEYVDEAGRRDLARRFRATAFRAAVEVLAADKPDDVAPDLDPAVPFYEHAAAYSAGLAVYGWVPVADVADEQAAAQLVADAEPFGSLDALHAAESRALVEADVRRRTATLEPSASPAVEAAQLALWDDEDAAAATPGPVVVIPCSGAKLGHAAPAGQLYTGSLHRMARRVADALTADGGTVLILSALHGLLHLGDVVEPYDLRMGDAASITPAQLASQARALGLADAEHVTVLAPKAYTAAVLAVWPHAHAPLTGSRGIGDQRGRLARLLHTATFAVAA